MLIQKINELGLFNNQSKVNQSKSTYSIAPSFGLKINSQLNQDSVSFEGTPKKLTDRTQGVSLATAKIIHDMIKSPQQRIGKFLRDCFGDLVATTKEPKNPIKAIREGAKMPRSIMEKSATRKWNSIDEVLANMTDLNRGKFEMRDATKPTVDALLDRFIPLIKTGKIELLEVENKRPIAVQGLAEHEANVYDYASIDKLQKLIATQETKWNGRKTNNLKKVKQNLFDDLTDTNYCAIHMLFKLAGRNARTFELQIMGANMSDFKSVDDIVWKILNGKEVDKKYNPVKKLVKNVMEDSEALDKFNKYRGEVALFQREKEPKTYTNKKSSPAFLPLPYDIPEELDYNNIYDLIQKCDLKAKTAEKNLKKAMLAKSGNILPNK